MNVLGISCFFHDSAAALVVDGQIPAAAREATLSKTPGAAQMPMRAINYCMQAGNLILDDVDYVVFHEKPFLKFLRVIHQYIRTWPRSLFNALESFPTWLDDRLMPAQVLERETGTACKALYLKHHYSHAAGAYLLSPFEEAAILTCDGVGEDACATWGRGRDASIQIEQELKMPSSPGLFYAALTEYLGFVRNQGEGCLAALAARGNPSYADRLLTLVDLRPDGSFRPDERYFSFSAGSSMVTWRFRRLFGPPRRPHEPLEQRHFDMAASAQFVFETVLLAMARQVHRNTGLQRLCLGGGCAHNADLLHRLRTESGFAEIYVPPLAGNDGAALGAALAVSCAQGGTRPESSTPPWWGPSVSAAHARRVLINQKIPFSTVEKGRQASQWSKALLEHGALGLVQGRLEYAARPLGSRCVLLSLGDASPLEQTTRQLGHRDLHAHVSLMVAQEEASALFEGLTEDTLGTATYLAKGEIREALGTGLRKDGKAVVQTVSEATHPILWQTLRGYAQEGNRLPVLAVLPLASDHEPLVNTAEDALRVARQAGLKRLALETLLVETQA